MTSFLFDLDGTLTLNGQKADPGFAEWFSKFQKTHDTYLVTGTEYQSVLYQIGPEITNQFKMVFTCCGNEIRQNGKVIHATQWLAPTELVAELQTMLAQSRCPYKAGQHIMQRTGVMSFTTAGRDSTPEQRKAYVEYDLASGERESMQIRLEAMFPDMDFTIAGELGIDMYPKGQGKDQVVKWIKDRPIIFYGDRTRPGGNDFPLAVVADMTHQVDDWQHTWELLRLISP